MNGEKMRLLLLLCALMVGACALNSKPSVVVEPAKIPPPPSALTESKPEPAGSYFNELTNWRAKVEHWSARLLDFYQRQTQWQNEVRAAQKASESPSAPATDTSKH